MANCTKPDLVQVRRLLYLSYNLLVISYTYARSRGMGDNVNDNDYT